MRRLALPLLLALAAGGCGDEGRLEAPRAATTGAVAAPRPAKRPAKPAVCRPLARSVPGTVASPAARELSGLALSHRRAGQLWAVNDSGDRPRALAFRLDGTLVADVAIPGAQAVDWEDLAIGPGGDLYLADIGDNRGARDAIDVYRVPEPELGASATAPAVRYALRYPDRAHDAETLLVDPRTGELAIVTKELSGASGVYVARRPQPAATTTLRRVATLELGIGGLATGGSVSADGRTIVIRTYTDLVAWSRRPSATLTATLRRTPCTNARTGFADEGQGEAVALSRSGRVLFTVAEGASPPVRRYTPRPAQR